jgi:hypothetical protein
LIQNIFDAHHLTIGSTEGRYKDDRRSG